VMWIIRTC